MNNEEKKNHIIHITHNDADAVGCALVAASRFSASDIVENTYFCSIGTQDKKITDVLTNDIENGNIPHLIIISDLSLLIDTCSWLEETALTYGFKLLGVDHHVTNKLNETFNWFHVYSGNYLDESLTGEITTISAAEAMMNDVLPSVYNIKEFSDLIKMISRYDTWVWRSHPYDWTNEYSGMYDDTIAKICMFMGPDRCFKEVWKLWEKYIDDRSISIDTLVPEYFYSIYDSMKFDEERYIKSIPYKAHVTKFLDTYMMATIICENSHANAACEWIYNNFDFIDIVSVIYVTSGKIGLRTKKDDINVAELAKKYWNEFAGGHPKAAGSTIPKTEMISALITYVLNSETLIEASTRIKEQNKYMEVGNNDCITDADNSGSDNCNPGITS